jgi:hypothetical protein
MSIIDSADSVGVHTYGSTNIEVYRWDNEFNA